MSSYEKFAKRFTNELETEHTLFNEYHALIVRLGKTYCRSKPQWRAVRSSFYLPIQFLFE